MINRLFDMVWILYHLDTSSIDDLVSVNIETAYDAMIETPHHLWMNNNTALTNIGIQTSLRLLKTVQFLLQISNYSGLLLN